MEMFCNDKRETLINPFSPVSAPAFRFSPYTVILCISVPMHTSIFLMFLGVIPPFYTCFRYMM